MIFERNPSLRNPLCFFQQTDRFLGMVQNVSHENDIELSFVEWKRFPVKASHCDCTVRAF
jgi:hypothetical protein